MNPSHKTAFLGTPGYIQQPERFSVDDLMKASGQNTGNLMFQLAARRLIGGEHNHIGFSGLAYADPEAYRDIGHFVFPAANHLRAGGDYWAGLLGLLNNVKVPLVVLGLGAQAETGVSPLETARLLKADGHVVNFISCLKDKAALVTVRGTFSEAVCHELGLDNVVRLGCPSLLLNPQRDLGVKMSSRLQELATGDIKRFALTAVDYSSFPTRRSATLHRLPGQRADKTLPLRQLEEKLFTWLVKADGLYIQQSGGTAVVELFLPGGFDSNEQKFQRIYHLLSAQLDKVAFGHVARIYFDAEKWISDLRGCDLSLGLRLHGNMAAMAADVPAIVIATDARMSELVDEMKLPKLSCKDASLAPDLAGLVRKAQFDGAAFDASRLYKARKLRDHFLKINLPVSKHLQQLADDEPKEVYNVDKE